MFVCNVQASEVLQLVRFPTMDQQELCEAAKHPVVVEDPKVQVHMPNPHAKLPHANAWLGHWALLHFLRVE